MITSNYHEFIKGLEINEIILNELEVKRISGPDKGHWSFDLSYNFDIKIISDDIINAEAEFLVKTLNKKTSKKLFTIKVIFQINYINSNKIELTKELEERFKNTNLPLNIWPYAREIISNQSTRMGYPPLIIGTFKIF